MPGGSRDTSAASAFEVHDDRIVIRRRRPWQSHHARRGRAKTATREPVEVSRDDAVPWPQPASEPARQRSTDRFFDLLDRIGVVQVVADRAAAALVEAIDREATRSEQVEDRCVVAAVWREGVVAG